MKAKEFRSAAGLLGCAALVLDAFLWSSIFLPPRATAARVYFLDVGQGESQLIELSGNVRVMVDAGARDAVVGQLDKLLPADDTYIDLAIISDASIDNFGGYVYLLDHYRVGAFAYNGRDATANIPEWDDLLEKIKAKHVPLITLGRGDVVRVGGNEMDVLSPDRDFAESPDLNDTALVSLLKTPRFKVLFDADTGQNVEKHLVALGDDLVADLTLQNPSLKAAVAKGNVLYNK